MTSSPPTAPAIGTKIIGLGTAIPQMVVTNADLEKMVETSDDWIASRTGIKQRRIVSGDESCTSLAIAAAREALAYAGIEAADIDLIIVATSTPDFLYPSTACLIQAEIGASKAGAFDVEAACSGIMYALTIGHQFITAGSAKTVLVVGADVHSRFLDWTDRNTCILFGDGAGAFVMQATAEDNDILACDLGADGSRNHLLKIPNPGGGFPQPGKEEEEEEEEEEKEEKEGNQVVDENAARDLLPFFQMDGRAVYEFAMKAVPEAVRTACQKADLTTADIDFFVPHQANKRIIDGTADRLGFKKEQIVCNIEKYGNTSAASIPLALHEALQKGQIAPQAVCALIGFGAGLTWGTAIIRWTAVDKRLI